MSRPKAWAHPRAWAPPLVSLALAPTRNAGTSQRAAAPAPAPLAMDSGLTAKGTGSGSVAKVAPVRLQAMEKEFAIPKCPSFRSSFLKWRFGLPRRLRTAATKSFCRLPYAENPV